MTDRDPTPPLSFEELTSELEQQLNDPLIGRFNDLALAADERLYTEEALGTATPELKAALVNHLDVQWPYMSKSVRYSGTMWVFVADNAPPIQIRAVDEPMNSHGFVIFSQPETVEGSVTYGRSRMAYFFDMDARAGNGARAKAFVTPEDIVHMELPSASDELRRRRFVYNFPREAAAIDEIAFTVPREDKVLLDLKDFYFDVNLNQPDDHEHLLDAHVYLRERITIDSEITHVVSLMGDILVVDDEGSGIPTTIRRPLTRPMRIAELVLRSADIRLERIEGAQRCVPFIEAHMFEANRTVTLMIPVTSLLHVGSLRYDGEAARLGQEQ